jgi:hypothetical protein
LGVEGCIAVVVREVEAAHGEEMRADVFGKSFGDGI